MPQLHVYESCQPLDLGHTDTNEALVKPPKELLADHVVHFTVELQNSHIGMVNLNMQHQLHHTPSSLF